MTAEDTFADLSMKLLGKDLQSLEPEELNVIQAIAERNLSSRDAHDLAIDTSTYGERLSDRVAAVGGSWDFIIVFGAILLAWMLINTDVLSHWGMAFDPYPYIFLNLMLSTVAAIQAPVIMMSQNRQATKDRMAASLDYEINLRAELEIMRLHEKFDLLQVSRLEQKLDALSARLETKGS